MEKIIKITGFSNAEKKDKSGTYPCFEVLLNGIRKNIGVFEDEVVNALKSKIDKWVKVELTTRPNSGFINITGFISDAKPEEIPTSADTELQNKDYSRKQEISGKEMDTISREAKAAPSEPSQKSTATGLVIHQIVDERPDFRIEVGSAGCRITAKGRTIQECRENAQVLLESARAMMARADSDEPEKK